MHLLFEGVEKHRKRFPHLQKTFFLSHSSRYGSVSVDDSPLRWASFPVLGSKQTGQGGFWSMSVAFAENRIEVARVVWLMMLHSLRRLLKWSLYFFYDDVCINVPRWCVCCYGGWYGVDHWCILSEHLTTTLLNLEQNLYWHHAYQSPRRGHVLKRWNIAAGSQIPLR